MTNIILLFIIYGLLGWIVEVLYVRYNSGHFYNRGFLHMPFLPIYAVGAITITISLQSLTNPLLVYGLGVIVTSILEYLTSFIMERLFHTRWWDYSHYKYNLNGRICLKNSLLFGVLSLVVIYGLNPLFFKVISIISEPSKQLIVNIFTGLFIVDLAYTLRNVSNMPIRDIRIISGKVKAYRDGKLRNLEELFDELNEYRHNDLSFREDLKDYTHKLAEKHQIHNLLLAALAFILVVGIIIGNIIILELISVIIVITISLYFYNRRHNKKS